MDSIQAEFSTSIYARNPPKVAQQVKLWVAMHNNEVVGTVGISDIGNGNAALKSMMVQQEYRGTTTGISARLLDTAIRHAKSFGAGYLFLGTMMQFEAARAFYQKNGFLQINMDELPAGFAVNPVDDVFFRLQIN
jgi:N-acetylglutamate synthase-like GNAT family acetyltransferase